MMTVRTGFTQWLPQRGDGAPDLLRAVPDTHDITHSIPASASTSTR
jgi:hypothetical protein